MTRARVTTAAVAVVLGAGALGGCGTSASDRYADAWDHGCQDVSAAYRTFRNAVASTATAGGDLRPTVLAPAARTLAADLEGPYRDLRRASPPARWAAWNRTAVRRLDATRAVVDAGLRQVAAGDPAGMARIAPGGLGPAARDAPHDLQTRTPSCSRLP